MAALSGARKRNRNKSSVRADARTNAEAHPPTVGPRLDSELCCLLAQSAARKQTPYRAPGCGQIPPRRPCRPDRDALRALQADRPVRRVSMSPLSRPRMPPATPVEAPHAFQAASRFAEIHFIAVPRRSAECRLCAVPGVPARLSSQHSAAAARRRSLTLMHKDEYHREPDKLDALARCARTPSLSGPLRGVLLGPSLHSGPIRQGVRSRARSSIATLWSLWPLKGPALCFLLRRAARARSAPAKRRRGAAAPSNPRFRARSLPPQSAAKRHRRSPTAVQHATGRSQGGRRPEPRCLLRSHRTHTRHRLALRWGRPAHVAQQPARNSAEIVSRYLKRRH